MLPGIKWYYILQDNTCYMVLIKIGFCSTLFIKQLMEHNCMLLLWDCYYTELEIQFEEKNYGCLR